MKQRSDGVEWRQGAGWQDWTLWEVVAIGRCLLLTWTWKIETAARRTMDLAIVDNQASSRADGLRYDAGRNELSMAYLDDDGNRSATLDVKCLDHHLIRVRIRASDVEVDTAEKSYISVGEVQVTDRTYRQEQFRFVDDYSRFPLHDAKSVYDEATKTIETDKLTVSFDQFNRLQFFKKGRSTPFAEDADIEPYKLECISNQHKPVQSISHYMKKHDKEKYYGLGKNNSAFASLMKIVA